jgi:hypothetical protein
MLTKEIGIAFTGPLPVANASAGVTAMPSLSAARASGEEFQYAVEDPLDGQCGYRSWAWDSSPSPLSMLGL